MDRANNRGTIPSRPKGCFSDQDLKMFLDMELEPAKDKAVYDHLYIDCCQYCLSRYQSAAAMLMEDLSDIEIKNLPPPSALLEKLERMHLSRKQMTPGQIWMTSLNTFGVTVPVLIVSLDESLPSTENIIRIMTISDDVKSHRSDHIVLLEPGKPLPYPVIVNVFDERPIAFRDLGRFRGLVPDETLRNILNLRARFQERQTEAMHPKFQVWKQREVELTARKAADTLGHELSEIKPHLLMQRDKFSIWIIQKRNKILLRFISDAIKPGIVKINGKTKSKCLKEAGVYQVVLGYVSQVPIFIDIIINVQGDPITFNVRFIMKLEE
jgi:hypothetical protein